MLKGIRIVENDRRFLQGFIQLNEDWITKYFTLEEADYVLAANPSQIIDKGCYVFNVINSNNDEHQLLGVCALFNQCEGVFELARMAVLPEHQGKGYGQLLIDACLNKLKAIHATGVYLVSNTQLTAAISLYKKNGFLVAETAEHELYSRANIVMGKELN